MRQFLKKIDKSLIILVALVFALSFFVPIFSFSRAFANGEEDESDIIEVTEFSYVTIYDENKKLSVRTDAKTVSELLSRANITLDESDSIEPSLSTEINTSTFFINIHRARPVFVIDGSVRKYSMTSSYDPKTIAKEAGFSIYDGDTITPIRNTNFLELGTVSAYEISRGDGATLTVEEEIPFKEESYKDYSLEAGKSEVVQLGEVGKKILVYKIKSEDGIEKSRELVSESIEREPISRITRVGANPIEMHPLTAQMGRNRYTFENDGKIIERQETFYDLNMSKVMKNAMYAGGVWTNCNHSGHYSVREDGVKIDDDGYVIIAANLDRYPRCSVVQTSLGQGKVYDTGSFAASNPEQFDIATDWTRRDGV